jgi:hypothetical protein
MARVGSVDADTWAIFDAAALLVTDEDEATLDEKLRAVQRAMQPQAAGSGYPPGDQIAALADALGFALTLLRFGWPEEESNA